MQALTQSLRKTALDFGFSAIGITTPNAIPQAAAQLRATGVSALLVDTSPQPQSSAEQLAAAMGAQYLALPYGGAQSLNQAVRAVAGRN